MIMLHNSSVPDCSLREEFIDLLKSASKIFLFLVYSGALVSTFHSNWWSLKYFKCLPGSDSTLFGTPETLDHSFKLKIKLNTTAALFTKVIVRVVKNMSVNPWEMLF